MPRREMAMWSSSLDSFSRGQNCFISLGVIWAFEKIRGHLYPSLMGCLLYPLYPFLLLCLPKFSCWLSSLYLSNCLCLALFALSLLLLRAHRCAPLSVRSLKWVGPRCGCWSGQAEGWWSGRGSFLSATACSDIPLLDGYNTRRGRVAWRMCQIVLKAPKPLSPEYPKQLKKLGDHIKKRRLDRGLTQRQVASIIGVNKGTIGNWEACATQPTDHCISKIIDFFRICSLSSPQISGWKAKTDQRKFGIYSETACYDYGGWPIKYSWLGIWRA